MKDKLRELLYKYTDKVDNWNDAIFTDEFDDLVDELDALFAKRIVIRRLKEAMPKVQFKEFDESRKKDYVYCIEWGMMKQKWIEQGVYEKLIKSVEALNDL